MCTLSVPATAPALPPCEGEWASVAYEADTLPEEDPLAPWTASYQGDVDAWVEDGVLVVRAERYGQVVYDRLESALAGASQVALDSRMWLEQPLVGPTQLRAELSVRDGERLAAVQFLLLEASHVQLRLATAPGTTPPEMTLDWNEPHDLRLELERGIDARVFLDGAPVLEAAYADLPEAASGTEGVGLVQFGSSGSLARWDWLRYGLCGPAAAEPPPLGQQLEVLRSEAAALAAPEFVGRWLDRRLDAVAREDDPSRQGRELLRIGEQLFHWKAAGVVRADAGRLETLLDFARTTAAPELTRLDGYRDKLHIVSVLPKSPGLIPGVQPLQFRVFADLDRGALPAPTAPSRSFGLLLRLGAVRLRSGEVLRVASEIHPLEPDDLLGRTVELAPQDVVWFGDTDEGGWTQADDLFIDIEVVVVEFDRLTWEVIGYHDAGAWGGRWPWTPPRRTERSVGRVFRGAVQPVSDWDLSSLVINGRYFLTTAELQGETGGAICDPVLHLLDPVTGAQLAFNDDCAQDLENWVWHNGAAITLAVRCEDAGGQALACPDPRGTTRSCLMRDFSGTGPRVVLRAHDDSARGSAVLEFWQKTWTFSGGIVYRRLWVSSRWPAGGSRLRYDGGWTTGDEMDAIVPAPESAAAHGGAPPARQPALYLLAPDEGLAAVARGNGMGGGARFSNLAATAEATLIASSDGEATGGLTVVVNDVAHAAQRDVDGLGQLLEAALGTDPDDIDTDGDGIWDGFEVLGIRGAGLYPDQALPTWGADPLHKDVFLETDYYTSPTFDHPGQPLTPAGATFMAGVAAQCSGGPGYLDNPDGRDGFAIHVDNRVEPLDVDGNRTHSAHGAWGGTSAVPASGCDGFGCCFQYEVGWRHHMNPIRHGVFRYAVGCPLGGGTGAVGHPYFYFNSEGTPEYNGPGKIAIHELGHNLGLEHYGKPEAGSNFNDKPHYISLMNYTYQFGSPNESNSNAWDPNHLRFSEGERRYVLDAAGNRTGEEYSLDPAAIEEATSWQDIASHFSTTGHDLTFGSVDGNPFPWLNVLVALWPQNPVPRLWVDWDRDGVIDTTTGAVTKADVLADGGSSFKLLQYDADLKAGPRLFVSNEDLFLFFVREGSSHISYRVYHEDDDCDPEDVGPAGQDEFPDSHTPPCGSWSAEMAAASSVAVDSQIGACASSSALHIFYLDASGHLCMITYASSSWADPVCLESSLEDSPEPLVFQDDLIVFSLGVRDAATGLGRVVAIEIPIASMYDATTWLVWPVSRCTRGTCEPLLSRTTPAAAIDPSDSSLLIATTDSRHEMALFQNSWSGWIFFEQLPDPEYWLDHPKGLGTHKRTTDARPALVIERSPTGKPRWTLWLHGDTLNTSNAQDASPGPQNQFYRMVSSMEGDPDSPHPAFSRVQVATPNGVFPTIATAAGTVSLAIYRGKLRAAVGFDIPRGPDDIRGYIFFPLADGVFHAALKDVNDVEIVGQNMSETLGPLFLDMSWSDLITIALANHILAVPGDMNPATLRKDSGDTAFDGVPDRGPDSEDYAPLFGDHHTFGRDLNARTK